MLVKLNCKNCSKNCCEVIENMTPVLLISEEEKFAEFAQPVKTDFRTVYLLKKNNETGVCIFYNSEKKQCNIYQDDRPFECKIYPYLLDFSSDNFGIKLDERFCEYLDTLEADKDKILELLKNENLPEDWINAYKSIDNLINGTALK